LIIHLLFEKKGEEK